MERGPARSVLREIATLYTTGSFIGLSDADLLERFLARVGDDSEDAFAALVARHGPTVLGVCRRMLPGSHDAEDAFQATFVVLARRAASIGRRERLASWLYGVAVRTAKEARRRAARERAAERRLMDLSRIESEPPRWTGGLAPAAGRGAESPAAAISDGTGGVRAGGGIPTRGRPAARHPRGDTLHPSGTRAEVAPRSAAPPRSQPWTGPDRGPARAGHRNGDPRASHRGHGPRRARLGSRSRRNFHGDDDGLVAGGKGAQDDVPREADPDRGGARWTAAAGAMTAVVLGLTTTASEPPTVDPPRAGPDDLAGRVVDKAGAGVADVRVWAMDGPWQTPQDGGEGDDRRPGPIPWCRRWPRDRRDIRAGERQFQPVRPRAETAGSAGGDRPGRGPTIRRGARSNCSPSAMSAVG